ncbi:MAG: FtsX-like permease family protein, partial [Bacteroidota bacterium]|nr:FtsX-like permease family protein [Bacteroidota bacterium]
ALSDGMLKERNEKVINEQLSHIQLHNQDFYNNPKIKDTIYNVSEVIETLDKRNDIDKYTTRLKFLGMINSARSSQGVMITGISPEEEKNVTTIYKYMIDSSSSYLTPESTNEIIISTKVAQTLMLVYYEFNQKCADALLEINFDPEILAKLNVISDISMRSKNSFKDSLRKYFNSEEYEKYADMLTEQSTQYRINKKVILKFNNANGDFVSEAFKVVGIFKTSDAMFDNMNVFVNKEYIAKLMEVPVSTATEIAIITNDLENVVGIVGELDEELAGVLVESYIDLDPISMYQGDFIEIFYNILIAFILFALSFGIINTVLMSVMERTKEIGMVMAIGMKKGRIFLMIMYESIMISLTGGVVGMILGAAISLYFGKVGIDISGYSSAMESFGISTVMYPRLSMSFFVGITILVVLTGILSAIYPAKRALKLNPSEAIRSDA